MTMTNAKTERDAARVPLDAYLSNRRRIVEAALDAHLPPPDQCAPRLREAMHYSLAAGGKRLRPVLALAAAEAVAGDETAEAVALPIACALEYIHTYSLIHDDLPAMDNDTLRRGRPTSHVVFGEALAILAGDALLTEAFRIATSAPAELAHVPAAELDRRRVLATARLATAAGALGMVGGQALDLEAEAAHLAPKPGEVVEPALQQRLYETLRAIHAAKTGALIRAAATCGAIMAGASTEQVTAIDAYAADLGLAFQIVDDVLDVEGDASTLGKTAGKDAAAGKLTYPSLFGLAQSKRMAEDAVGRACRTLEAAGIGGRLPELARLVVSRQS